MATGRVYDKNENATMISFLDDQSNQLKQLDSEKNIANKKAIKYGIIILGSIGIVLAVSFLSRKK